VPCGGVRKLGFLGSKRGFELASFGDIEDRIACGGLRVKVVPDAVSSSDNRFRANAVWLGFGLHLVAQKLRDGAQVEVDEHDGDKNLAGGEPSHPSTSRGGDKLLAFVFETTVQGLDRLAGVVVELVPLRTHERERLLLPQGVLLGEGDGVLFADAVKEFGNVRLFDRGSFLIGCPFGKLAERAGNGGAVAECLAATTTTRSLISCSASKNPT
jgi:hypothetical protein